VPEANVEVVRRFLDAAERDDLPGSLACLDPDLEWVPLRAATEGVYHGHEGFEKFVADTDETFEIFRPHFELNDLGGEQVLAWGRSVCAEEAAGSTSRFRLGAYSMSAVEGFAAGMTLGQRRLLSMP
jgi:ketosteroid isomerase-like protein